MPQAMDDGAARRLFKNGEAWRAWLAKHHDKKKGIWLLYYKKGSGKSLITYTEALEEALSFGWIDSIARKVDGERYMQKYTPRHDRSLWSVLNKERVARLIAEGRMTEHGLAKIEAAKRNGSWTRIDAIDRASKSRGISGKPWTEILRPGSFLPKWRPHPGSSSVGGSTTPGSRRRGRAGSPRPSFG